MAYHAEHMILAHATWTEVEPLDRETVVVIPTGSLEQHGPHLPLFTDSLIVTAVAAAVEARMPEELLLTPTVWLGASGHHLPFPGTLSAGFETYEGALESVITSLVRHGFRRFYVLNGHGGNTDPNHVLLRRLKERHPNLVLGESGYCDGAADVIRESLKGPTKEIVHACEAETSLMLHLHPNLVRTDRLPNDGLAPEPPVRGLVSDFSEITVQGAFGYAKYAAAETGRRIFEACVEDVERNLRAFRRFVYVGEAVP